MKEIMPFIGLVSCIFLCAAAIYERLKRLKVQKQKRILLIQIAEFLKQFPLNKMDSGYIECANIKETLIFFENRILETINSKKRMNEPE